MRRFFEKENSYLWIILLIASAFRLYHYSDWSYTHDELGAFERLHYASFPELIREGVMNGDTHPAFVQVLLFVWAKLFGLSEAAIRLPFVLAGVGSVALVYLIARRWFGFTPACLTALTVALLDFPILYSQLARPYSFGLFFSLLAAWCWTDLLFGNGKKIYLKAAAYGLATAGCMLTHYFAFFFAMMTAATGFFFLRKETWKPYLLSGGIALVLFLPHLSVSLHQFGMGGIGSWLAKPEPDFLWKFILYCFNDSALVFVSAVILCYLSVLMYPGRSPAFKFRVICIAWFLLPFLAGYYYSRMVNPVLQYSTLLFSFPFLPMLLFSWFGEEKSRFNRFALGGVGALLLYSTLFDSRFYKREYFGVFKEIDRAVLDLQKKYGSGNVTTVLNTSSREIFNFYFEQWKEKAPFAFYAGDSLGFTARMLRRLDTCTTPYFLYGWSNFRSPYEIPELIREKYPCVVYDDKHFNSQVTLFGKNDTCSRDTVFYLHSGFDAPMKNGILSFDSLKKDSVQVHSGKYSLLADKVAYCITLKAPAEKLGGRASFDTGKMICVNLSAWILPVDTAKFNVQMVLDLDNGPGREWHAVLLKPFIREPGKWQRVFATFQIPASAYPDDELKLLLWNPAANSFRVDDFTVSSFADSDYDYYAPSFIK